MALMDLIWPRTSGSSARNAGAARETSSISQPAIPDDDACSHLQYTPLHLLKLEEGDEVLAQSDACLDSWSSGRGTYGQLLVTHVGLCFLPADVDGENARAEQERARWYDWGEILRAESPRESSPLRRTRAALSLRLRYSSRPLRIDFFDPRPDFAGIADLIAKKSSPRSPLETFAFRNPIAAASPASLAAARGAGRWSAEDHFVAQLGSRSGWRFSYINANYDVCSTYPSVVVVPANVDDATLAASAAFRARGRFPILAYRHWNGAALVRCGQPTPGIAGQVCTEDEDLIRAIGEVTNTPVVICDARSRTAALGNTAIGGGSESSRRYRARVEFLNLENLRAVQAAYDAVQALCEEHPPPASWLSRFERTRWPEQLRALLGAARRVAQLLHQRHSVVLHCTDGTALRTAVLPFYLILLRPGRWDRTAQVASLAEAILSPRARTAAGLADLVEAQWLQAGHQFATRAGFSFAGAGAEEQEAGKRGPIFAQFCEALAVLQSQAPAAFDFAPGALAALARDAASFRFADGLFDSQRDRDRAKSKSLDRTPPSFLDPLRGASRSAIRRFSAAAEPEPEGGAGAGAGERRREPPLRVSLHPEGIRLWRAHFLPGPGPGPGPGSGEGGVPEELEEAPRPPHEALEERATAFLDSLARHGYELDEMPKVKMDGAPVLREAYFAAAGPRAGFELQLRPGYLGSEGPSRADASAGAGASSTSTSAGAAHADPGA
eukprot:tig00020816_g14158.t1